MREIKDNKGGGKHGKFTDDLAMLMEDMLSVGMSDRLTAQAVGISTPLFYAWKRKSPYEVWECDCKRNRKTINGKLVEVNRTVMGSYQNNNKRGWDYTGKLCPICKAEYRLKPTFAERVDTAKANGILNVIQDFKGFTPENWQAARDFLKTVHHKHFGKNVVELTGRGGQPIQTINIDIDKDSDTEAQRKYADLLKKINSGEEFDEEDAE